MDYICKIHDLESVSKLKAVKLKVTPARLGVLDILTHAKKPLLVEEIKQHIRMKKIDLVTIYRTVRDLVELGVINSPVLGNKRAYYETLNIKHHHHLVCTSCGCIEELENCTVKGLNIEIIQKKGFKKILRHSLEYFGLCRKCG